MIHDETDRMKFYYFLKSIPMEVRYYDSISLFIEEKFEELVDKEVEFEYMTGLGSSIPVRKVSMVLLESQPNGSVLVHTKWLERYWNGE